MFELERIAAGREKIIIIILEERCLGKREAAISIPDKSITEMFLSCGPLSSDDSGAFTDQERVELFR